MIMVRNKIHESCYRLNLQYYKIKQIEIRCQQNSCLTSNHRTSILNALMPFLYKKIFTSPDNIRPFLDIYVFTSMKKKTIIGIITFIYLTKLYCQVKKINSKPSFRGTAGSTMQLVTLITSRSILFTICTNWMSRIELRIRPTILWTKFNQNENSKNIYIIVVAFLAIKGSCY